MTDQTPEELAVTFLSHFIDAEQEELESLTITHALSDLIISLVQETATIIHKEPRILH
jgi:hypothetical protein